MLVEIENYLILSVMLKTSHIQDLLKHIYLFDCCPNRFKLARKNQRSEVKNLFVLVLVVYGPFWEHILSFWKIRDQENILFLKYENMKKDLAKVIQETSTFLGKSVPDEEIQTLQDHL
ncbi:Sulfotransfer 1 domain containing protein, partial [Asbolus verrucosus]